MVQVSSQFDLLRSFPLGPFDQEFQGPEIAGQDAGKPDVADLFGARAALLIRDRHLLEHQVSHPSGPRPAGTAGVTGPELSRLVREGHAYGAV
jgi:hypothetical protein